MWNRRRFYDSKSESRVKSIGPIPLILLTPPSPAAFSCLTILFTRFWQVPSLGSFPFLVFKCQSLDLVKEIRSKAVGSIFLLFGGHKISQGILTFAYFDVYKYHTICCSFSFLWRNADGERFPLHVGKEHVSFAGSSSLAFHFDCFICCFRSLRGERALQVCFDCATTL